ncbi:uncharacterized protein [Arachis hypogaea]|uniref:uncharacterized protein n=1 Tax=Arachis hypogaea TaxID=3818 RepID=UPI000DED28B3|nr:uncharacterized protein LOC112717193 [Arachis hypogaea]
MDQDVRFYVSLIQDDDDDPVYDYESETLHTPISSDDESSKHKFPEFNDDYEHGEGRFELGTRFATIERFKEVVKDSFIAEGRELRWIKNDKERVRMRCMDDECSCLVHLSYNKSLQCYQVKTYKNDHTCARDMESNAADQHWISLKVEKRMNTQSHVRTSEAIDFLREEFSLTAHPKMVYKAVREARERIMGNEREQYSNVRGYLFEILRSNPGSRVELCVTPIPQSPYFNKLYICLEACKQGFKSGCRPLIHLDGYFLKTYYGGQLLTAVAQDANNQFYVVAYGVARSETMESWKWFLTLLEEDLGDGSLPALKAVMPNAHHRNCVMYIWKNFINRFNIPKFKEQMEKFKRINQGAWEYLSKFEPATWVKAYFSHGPKVDNLTNNMCEVFN